MIDSAFGSFEEFRKAFLAAALSQFGSGWAWLVAGVVATGIIFSRLYLGAHDVEDVLGGALLGLATLLVFEWVRRWSWWRDAHAGWHLVLILLAFSCAWLSWPGAAPSYVPLLAGMLLGVLFGYRQLAFSAEVVLWRRLAAAVLGALAFIVALMGWMPAPIEISAINSLWVSAKRKLEKVSYEDGLFDFNVGYISTAILAVSLGLRLLDGQIEFFAAFFVLLCNLQFLLLFDFLLDRSV